MDIDVLRNRIIAMAETLPNPPQWQIERRLDCGIAAEMELGHLFPSGGPMAEIGYDIPLVEFLNQFGECPLKELLLLAECLNTIADRHRDTYPKIDKCLSSFWSAFPRQRV